MQDAHPLQNAAQKAKALGDWLDLLGRNCCAGRSYQQMDDATRPDAGGAGPDATETPTPVAVTPEQRHSERGT